ncbi:MAG: hypothetical protein ACYT04_33785 [Nostoc sp.]
MHFFAWNGFVDKTSNSAIITSLCCFLLVCLMGFLHLSRPALVNLAVALETGRLSPPFSTSNVANYIPAALNRDILDELNRLNVIGVHSQHIAYTLRLLAEERSTSQ